MSSNDETSAACRCGCGCSAVSPPDVAAQTIVALVTGTDPRSKDFMPGWALELARQKLLFMTSPSDFGVRLAIVISALDEALKTGDLATRTNCVSFLLGIAESLKSVVELHHNLQNPGLHGSDTLPDAAVTLCYEESEKQIKSWCDQAPDAAKATLDTIKTEDLAVNKGDNLFISWAKYWEAEQGVDPYSSIDEYLKCFTKLYGPETYYVELFLAWERGETKTQFFNDYGLHAARCRRIGSLGGTTNPAIAVMGEDDLSGKGNIWGEEAIRFINRTPNKWNAVRHIIARQQIDRGDADDWGATAFTEWVVVDAMLGLRCVFLLHGLGRVAFQLRPDWHFEEEKMAYAGGAIYALLCERVKLFDDILLEGAGEPFASATASRINKSNNHFKVSCTGQAALDIVKAFNAGYHPKYPDAVKERMWTNMTLSYDVSQMVASSIAVEEGMAEYAKRTGEKVDDGKGGSVVTSMIGRFNDAIRIQRVQQLLKALPADSHFRNEIKPSAVKSLDAAPLNTAEFLEVIGKAGMLFSPAEEEDAIDHAGTLCTKRAVMHLEHKYGWPKTRMLTASKRQFHQNTDLLDVPFSTDFGNIQRMYLELAKSGDLKIESWRTLYDEMNPDGTPASGSIWEKRSNILGRIWPDWNKAFDPEGVKPKDYINTIYVPPTLEQFTGFWTENVARAEHARVTKEHERSKGG